MLLRIFLIVVLFSLESFSQEILVSQGGTVQTCSGSFFDSGGSSGVYGSNENYIITICPEQTGQVIQLDFQSFSTQPLTTNGGDGLIIYNGDNISADEFGVFSGTSANSSPGFIAANNPTGCLTFEFTSDGAASTSGWEAIISCYEPCQDISGSIDNVIPAPSQDGNILVCPGDQVEFFGSAQFSVSDENSTYSWDFGDGNSAVGQNVTHTFNDSGIYSVGLSVSDDNPEGCSSIQVTQIVLVAPSIDFSGTQAISSEICFGESTIINGVAETTQLEDCAPEIFEQTWLQDTQTTGQGVSYESTINVECYADNLFFTDVNQLLQICVVIEHSYIGDLDMFLTSPNGDIVYFASYADGNNPSGNLGIPDESDDGSPGTGWNYCFSPTSNVDISNSVANGTVPEGTYGASGSSSFSDLIGSPLNGEWTFTVTDSWAIDDGTLFSWNLDFDPALSAPPSVIVSEQWEDNPSITQVDGNNITVSPTEAGEHCYSYIVLDDFGCEYSETVCINVIPEIIVEEPINLNICDDQNNSLIFDLSINQDLITSISPDPSLLEVSFYTSQQDAENDNNEIQNIESFSGNDDQIIYSRIDYLGSACFEISNFLLNVIPYPEINDIDNQTLCDTTGNGEVEFDLNLLTQDIIGSLDINDYNTTYYLNSADAQNSVNQIDSLFNVTDGLQVYARVDALDTGCGIYTINPIIIFTVLPGDDSSFELTATCDGATAEVTGVTGGTFAFSNPPSDAAVIDPVTGTITGGGYNTTYEVSYTSDDLCPTTSLVSVTTIEADDSSFELTATCDGATAEVTGVTGGTFAFVNAPTDGAVIDSSTGTITGGDYGSTYNISYTSDDLCPTTTILAVSSLLPEDSSFVLTATCDGATAEVTGVTGGTFAFVNAPTDGAVIDSSTGTITGGDYGTTYSVSYTTNGSSDSSSSNLNLCSSTTVQEITTIQADDSSFVLTATCDGATAEVTGVTGGTFTFSNPPSDAAVIDPVTGTITGGGYNTTYEVSYTSNETQPNSENLIDEYSLVANQVSQTSFNTTPGNSYRLEISGDIITGFGPGNQFDVAFSTAVGPGGSYPEGTPFNFGCQTLIWTSLFCDNPSLRPSPDVYDPINHTYSYPFTATTNTIDVGFNDSPLSDNEANTVNFKLFKIEQNCPTTTINEVTTLAQDDSSFAMEPTCDGANATVLGLPGGLFAFVQPPTDGAIIDSLTGNITGGSSGSEYEINYTTSGACPTTSSQNVTVNSPPEINNPTPLEVCDDNIADGLTEIDLTLKNTEITGGNTDYAVSYYFSLNEAESGSNPLPVIYSNISNPQTIYVRVVDIQTGCHSTTTMDLIVASAPSATAPSDLFYCDADADGFGVFDLTQLDGIISSGQIGLSITYHETQADAENNVNAIIGDYNNIVAYEQTIYIRVESSTISTDCGTILSTKLVVNDVPQINMDPSSLEVCDDNTDGFGLFDLSLSNAELLNGLDPLDYNITYYETAENAENGLDPIATPFAYTNVTPFNHVVWVRVENNTTACYNTSSIELTVNGLPVLTQPEPLNLCDYNDTGDEVEEFTLEDSIGEVLQGQTGIDITFYETQEDADNDTNEIFSPYPNTSNAQTIYLRGQNQVTGCYSTITLDLRVNPIPSPAVPEPIKECDEDNDGFTFFTVEDNEVDIINGELDIVLSYYETMTNAENAIDPIISPYYNIVPDSQIIFVRAENVITGCINIVEQELVTIPSPELPLIIEDIIVCDDDYDGISVFDLTQRDDDIFGLQNTTDFSLTYHETLIDAETGDSPIVNNTSYQNLTTPQTIYVRLEDLNNGCVSIGEFDLIVALPPDILNPPTPLDQCDDDTADQITVFDLTVKDDEITAGNVDWEVIYYETEQDALDGINAIGNPESYTNTSVAGNAANPQTLYVAVVNVEGCIAYTTLTIRVLPNPTPSTDPEPIELCDYNNPGDQIEVFDITVNEAYIINGELGVSAAYYESLENAVGQIDPIADPTNYTNVEPAEQTIYVRVTNNTTDCFTIVTFDIIVNPLPDIGNVPDVIACEVNTDGFYDFDLDTVTSELLGSQDPANFTVTYHETQQEADNGENALPSPYTNTQNPQQLFVNITNNTTSCNITGAGFNIEVQEGAIANGDGVPAELIICEDPTTENDGIAQFNLTDLDTQILDGQDPANFTVSYYGTLQDAEASVNELPITFENTTPFSQVIFARVDNDTTANDQCYDITQVTLLVNLLPEFTLQDSYTACVDVNGTELIPATVMEINLPASQYNFEWIDPTGAIVATTATHIPLMGGTYIAVAIDIATGCRKEVTTEVITSSPAIVQAVVSTVPFADEHIIEANAVGTGNYEYSLDDGPWQLDGTFTDVSPGEHIITVRDLNGCGIGTKSVLVIDYPRFFTPNGDGYNDTWQIIGIETRPLSKIYIFDRYGKLLKQLSPLSEGWDGTFNGKPLPATDYWFTVTYEEPSTEIIKTFRAHFSLKR